MDRQGSNFLMVCQQVEMLKSNAVAHFGEEMISKVL
jgi:hypothetical protein